LAVVAFRDGGATAVGFVALARMVPSALASPFLTSFADRLRRERVLATVSAVRALATGSAALLLGMGADVFGVYALAVVATIAVTVFRPVHSALLPSLCTTTRELTSTNVARGILDSSAALFGPALAGVLLALSGATAVFIAAAALSLAAALQLMRIRYEAPPRVAAARPAIGRDAVEGIRAVARHPDLIMIFGLGFAQTIVRGALNVFIVVVALGQLHTGDAGVAALSAALGAGGVIGSLGVSLLVGSRHLGAWLAVAMVLWGIPIALIGVSQTKVAAFALVAVVGLGNAIGDVPFFTLPVRLAPDAVLARVFGVFESLISLGVGIGSVLTPALITLLNLRGALIAIGLLLPVLVTLCWRRLTALDGRLGVRDDEIDVLRHAPMFGLLPVASIEHLASQLRRRMFPAGTVVFEQGDPASDFYIVVDGGAEVIGNGALLATLGPGDSFGEIALMHDVPRTATIRAESDLNVFELDRDAFLDAIGGFSKSSDAAQAVVARHLANFTPAATGI
jgi:MFS family permease